MKEPPWSMLFAEASKEKRDSSEQYHKLEECVRQYDAYQADLVSRRKFYTGLLMAVYAIAFIILSAMYGSEVGSVCLVALLAMNLAAFKYGESTNEGAACRSRYLDSFDKWQSENKEKTEDA